MTRDPRAAIDAAIRADRRRVPDDATLVAVGWATVDLDRASDEVAIEDPAAVVDPTLGAVGRRGTTADGLVLVVLEPAGEGRLAASLARFDEGPVATWWDVDRIDGLDLLPPADGPFGPVRRAPDTIDGRVRFLRARQAATISG